MVSVVQGVSVAFQEVHGVLRRYLKVYVSSGFRWYQRDLSNASGGFRVFKNAQGILESPRVFQGVYGSLRSV